VFILYSGYIDDDAVFYGLHMSEMDPIFKNCDAWLFLLSKLYFPSATILIFYFGEKTRYLVSGVILRLTGAFTIIILLYIASMLYLNFILGSYFPS